MRTGKTTARQRAVKGAGCRGVERAAAWRHPAVHGADRELAARHDRPSLCCALHCAALAHLSGLDFPLGALGEVATERSFRLGGVPGVGGGGRGKEAWMLGREALENMGRGIVQVHRLPLHKMQPCFSMTLPPA
jgi:hypothetical protein